MVEEHATQRLAMPSASAPELGLATATPRSGLGVHGLRTHQPQQLVVYNGPGQVTHRCGWPTAGECR